MCRSKEENEIIIALIERLGLLSFLRQYPENYREDYYNDCIVIILESYDKIPLSSVINKCKRKIRKKHVKNVRYKTFIFIEKEKTNKLSCDTLNKIEYNIWCLMEDGFSLECISEKTSINKSVIKFIIKEILRKLREENGKTKNINGK